MKNPFTRIAESERLNVVEVWMAAGAVENMPSGWDLLMHEDEWGTYTLGQVRRLAGLAGIGLEVPALDLGRLLHSSAVTDTMEEGWISGVQSLDDVYVDLILDFQTATQQGVVHAR